MSDLNEWAKSLETGLAIRQKRKAQETAAFAARQELLGNHSPALWTELQVAFKRCCDVINKGDTIKLIFNNTTPELLVIQRKGGTTSLTVVRDPHTHTVSIHPGALSIGGDKYKPGIVTIDGDDTVLYKSSGLTMSCEDIAKETLGAFIRKMSS